MAKARKRSLSSSRGSSMSWFNLIRLAAVAGLAGLTAGCFQPLYSTNAAGGPGIVDKMSAVEVAPINVPNGTRLSRVGGEVRNELIYELTGGGGAATTAYRLHIRLTSSTQSVIVDVNT